MKTLHFVYIHLFLNLVDLTEYTPVHEKNRREANKMRRLKSKMGRLKSKMGESVEQKRKAK